MGRSVAPEGLEKEERELEVNRALAETLQSFNDAMVGIMQGASGEGTAVGDGKSKSKHDDELVEKMNATISRIDEMILEEKAQNQREMEEMMKEVDMASSQLDAGKPIKAADIGKPAKAAGSATQEPAYDVEPITRLDLRVGKILSCEAHPEGDTLYVEKIDVGDAQGPRTIISGLAKHIPVEEMVGKMVAVVCNLKPAKMRGIESFGMVLCGSDADHNKVELLEPAQGSVVGERLSLESFGVLEPAAEDRVLKSKSQQRVWPKVALDLLLDKEGQATYRGQLFTTSQGPLRCASLSMCALG